MKKIFTSLLAIFVLAACNQEKKSNENKAIDLVVSTTHYTPSTKQMKPTFRGGTKKAIDELAEELKLPNDLTMQYWSYQVSDPNDLDKYISHYNLTTDDDKKFVLMEMILQAIVDQSNEEQVLRCWKKVYPILTDDFKIHEFTVYYWKELTEDNFDNCKILSPLLRQLWESKN